MRRLVCVNVRSFVWAMVVTALAIASAIPEGMAQAQEAVPDLVSRRVRLRGADDPNVKAGGELNVRDKGAALPTPATRSPRDPALCSVTFGNRTNLIAKVYVDGQFAGTLRPLADLTTEIAPGSAMLYARAEYDDQSADAWGPVRINCRTKYLWRLAD